MEAAIIVCLSVEKKRLAGFAKTVLAVTRCITSTPGAKPVADSILDLKALPYWNVLKLA